MKTTPFYLGDWLIDPGNQHIKNDTVTQPLEPLWMQVLLTLCQHNDRAVSSEELLQHCWGDQQLSDSPVHKTIAQLRKALGDEARNPKYIETIRKRGYRVIAAIQDISIEPQRTPTWAAQCPYPGLEAFDSHQAEVFFGRDQARKQLLETTQRILQSSLVRISTEPAATTSTSALSMILLLGASGSGKTSLIQAGYIPDLIAHNSRYGIRLINHSKLDLGELSSIDFYAALGSALLDWQLDLEQQETGLFNGLDAFSLGHRLQHHTQQVVQEIDAYCHRQHRKDKSDQPTSYRFLLFLDRFEVFFSLYSKPGKEQTHQLDVLRQLAQCSSLFIIIACRNDFYPQLVEQSLFRSIKSNQAMLDLSPPTKSEVAQIIRYPAKAAGLYFEQQDINEPSLDEVLSDATLSNPDALPLLQYTLNELYHNKTKDGRLSQDIYQQLGGLEGAISQRAESTLASLSTAAQQRFPEVFSLLISITDHDGAIISQAASWSSLSGQAAQELVTAFVDARLMVSQLIQGQAGFKIAHEAILRHWPRAVDWVSTHKKQLIIRSRLGKQSQRWHQEQQAKGLLLPEGIQLEEANDLLKNKNWHLTKAETIYIQASNARVSVRRWLRFSAVMSIVVLSVVTTVFAIKAKQAQHQAQAHQAEAEDLMGFMLGEFAQKLRPIGQLELLDDISSKALDYLADSEITQLSPASLQNHAKSLQVISEVNVARGHTEFAEKALEQANQILAHQLKKQNPQSEFGISLLQDLGVNAFWLGKIHMDHGRWALSREHFNNYLESTEQLNQIQPENTEWLIELSYAHNNLGTLALKTGDLKQADDSFSESIRLKRQAISARTDAHPQIHHLQAELADSLSWLGSLKVRQGLLLDGLALFQEELNIIQGIARQRIEEKLWQNRLAIAHLHQAELLYALGRGQEAHHQIQQATSEMQILVESQPDQRVWQRTYAYSLVWQYQILLDYQLPISQDKQLETTLSRAEEIADELLAIDRHRLDWVRLKARILLLQSEQQLTSSPDASLKLIQLAFQVMKMPDSSLSEDHTSLELFTRLLLHRALIAQHMENLTGVQQYCEQVVQLLSKESNTRDYHLIAPWTKALNCLQNNEQEMMMTQLLDQMHYQAPDRFL